MKIRTKLLPIALFAILFLGLTTTSCNKDDNPVDPAVAVTCSDGIQNGTETGIDCGGDCTACETTVEEDKQNIQSTFDNMLVCVEEMTSARAIDVLMRDFLRMSDGEAYNEDWVENLGENFDEVFDFEHIDDNQRFNISYHAGVYFYDHTTGSWGKDAATSDIITVRFPSSPDLTENNSTLVIDRYTDQALNLNDENVFGPKTIHAQLDVDGQKLFELTVDNITYADNTTYEVPVEIDASLFMDPMLITLDVKRNSSTEFFGTLSMNDGSSCNMSLEADVTLTDDDFENLSNDSFEKIHAKLGVGNLTVQSLAGLAELMNMEDEPDESTINSLLDLDVLFANVKIADLEYSEEEENFILYYKDESSESAASYIDDFIKDLEEIVTEFTGEW